MEHVGYNSTWFNGINKSSNHFVDYMILYEVICLSKVSTMPSNRHIWRSDTHGVLILFERIWNILQSFPGCFRDLPARDGNGVDKLEFCIGILIESLDSVEGFPGEFRRVGSNGGLSQEGWRLHIGLEHRTSTMSCILLSTYRHPFLCYVHREPLTVCLKYKDQHPLFEWICSSKFACL